MNRFKVGDSIEEYLAKTKNPVQLVKHFDEIPENKITYPLIGQIKYDGVYILIIMNNGLSKAYSRTGKEYYSELYSTAYFKSLVGLEDGVYIGELVAPTITLEELSGLVSTNRKAEWGTADIEAMEQSYVMLHDYLHFDEFLAGGSVRYYTDRYADLARILEIAQCSLYLIDNTIISSKEDAEQYADEQIKLGHEGAVFKQDLDWIAGHKGYRAMKIVRGLHLDLLCVGVEYGKGKRAGQIAKLKLSYKNHIFSADLGKGWTDEKRIKLTQDYEYYEQAIKDNDFSTTYKKHLTPINQIWEVKALQESSTGKALRLPKVVRVREDKAEPDA
ncbi:TPA: ATP-dependent DNA ligase [Salmonella enterica]|nr:ATP-dependent DNA ligase [Salmonella enterica]HCH8436885.1 ATP-dependent DNA ligase [Salmonella enterica]HCH9029275.1 ATP-dependent DNA ligase [Salmonella enterica]HCH9129510.1 ATP-dependent DNA ligase [Salmonella enterica]HCH9332853.1 ATP-dependent DNA ligase [Salmonella enterica]